MVAQLSDCRLYSVFILKIKIFRMAKLAFPIIPLFTIKKRPLIYLDLPHYLFLEIWIYISSEVAPRNLWFCTLKVVSYENRVRVESYYLVRRTTLIGGQLCLRWVWGTNPLTLSFHKLIRILILPRLSDTCEVCLWQKWKSVFIFYVILDFFNESRKRTAQPSIPNNRTFLLH